MRHIGWVRRVLSGRSIISALIFVVAIAVMGFVLHGSLLGRLFEGAVLIASMIVLWLIGTRADSVASDLLK